MDNKNNIIQWNCRGMHPNFEEIKILCQELNPKVICLQETKLKASDTPKLRGYTPYFRNYIDGKNACGGVAILVRSEILQSEIKINTPLQAAAARISLNDKSLTVCSVYIPPEHKLTKQELNNVIRQLPAPLILLGDFNGHSPLWGCNKKNDKGTIIEEVLSDNDLCIYNDKSQTYIHPATGATSSLDLTIASPSIFLDFVWQVHGDLHGSDHFPIKL